MKTFKIFILTFFLFKSLLFMTGPSIPTEVISPEDSLREELKNLAVQDWPKVIKDYQNGERDRFVAELKNIPIEEFIQTIQIIILDFFNRQLISQSDLDCFISTAPTNIHFFEIFNHLYSFNPNIFHVCIIQALDCFIKKEKKGLLKITEKNYKGFFIALYMFCVEKNLKIEYDPNVWSYNICQYFSAVKIRHRINQVAYFIIRLLGQDYHKIFSCIEFNFRAKYFFKSLDYYRHPVPVEDLNDSPDLVFIEPVTVSRIQPEIDVVEVHLKQLRNIIDIENISIASLKRAILNIVQEKIVKLNGAAFFPSLYNYNLNSLNNFIERIMNYYGPVFNYDIILSIVSAFVLMDYFFEKLAARTNDQEFVTNLNNFYFLQSARRFFLCFFVLGNKIVEDDNFGEQESPIDIYYKIEKKDIDISLMYIIKFLDYNLNLKNDYFEINLILLINYVRQSN